MRTSPNTILAGPGPNSMLWLASHRLPKNSRFVFFIRGDTEETLRRIYRRSLLRPAVLSLVRRFERRIRALARDGRAIVFAIGPELTKRYGGEENNCHCILPLLNPDMVPGDGGSSRACDGDPPRLLSMGRLSAEKNLGSLIDSVAALKRQGRLVHLTIAGTGGLKAEIQSLIRQRDLHQEVTLRGFVSHGEGVRQLLDSHDRLVLPSHTEGVPRAVIEAVARNTPVISTRVGSLPALFGNHLTWAESPSVASLTAAIGASIDAPETARSRASLARLHLERFRTDLEAKRVATILTAAETWA